MNFDRNCIESVKSVDVWEQYRLLDNAMLLFPLHENRMGREERGGVSEDLGEDGVSWGRELPNVEDMTPKALSVAKGVIQTANGEKQPIVLSRCNTTMASMKSYSKGALVTLVSWG